MSPEQEKFLSLLPPNYWVWEWNIDEKLEPAGDECVKLGLAEYTFAHERWCYRITPDGVRAIAKTDERQSKP